MVRTYGFCVTMTSSPTEQSAEEELELEHLVLPGICWKTCFGYFVVWDCGMREGCQKVVVGGGTHANTHFGFSLMDPSRLKIHQGLRRDVI